MLTLREVKKFLAAKGWFYSHKCGQWEYFGRNIPVAKMGGPEFSIRWHKKTGKFETCLVGIVDAWLKR